MSGVLKLRPRLASNAVEQSAQLDRASNWGGYGAGSADAARRRSLTPASAKVAMPVWQATAARQSTIASAAPEASPRRMSRSSSGRSASRSSRRRMARLGRAVRGLSSGRAHPAPAPAASAAAAPRRSRRAAPGCGRARCDDGARHGRDLAPAEPAQHLERIAAARRRAGPGRGRPPPPCARARACRGRCPGRSTICRAPPNSAAHSAAAEVVLPMPISPTASRSRPGPTAAMPRLSASRHSFSLIAGPSKNRPSGGRARAADPELGARGPAELIDGSAAGDEVRDHLRRHRRRIGGDAARRDAVVAGEHHDARALQPRRMPALPGGEPDRQLLEPAERARRLGQLA